MPHTIRGLYFEYSFGYSDQRRLEFENRGKYYQFKSVLFYMKASWMKCICATHFYIYLVLRSMLIPVRHRVSSSQLNSLYKRL